MSNQSSAEASPRSLENFPQQLAISPKSSVNPPQVVVAPAQATVTAVASPQPAAITSQASSGAISTPLFRPIEFETQVGCSEGSESGGSDSAYGSDQHTPLDMFHARPMTYYSKLSASVQNKHLWKMFTKIGNEMIVTKPGRRLFPSLLVNLHGLDPESDYTVSLRISSTDNQRYRYINMKWVATGDSEVIQNDAKQIFHHPSSPNSGHFWMKRPVSFKTIKITHFAKSKNGNILLHTMHKYSMEVILHCCDGTPPVILPLLDTTFIAVSAYQNMELTQLKIDNNPFAKGFRYKIKSQAAEGSPNTSKGTEVAKTANSTPTSVITPKVTSRPSTSVLPDRSMLAYIQHLHQFQNLAATPTYVPAVLTSPTASSHGSVLTSSATMATPLPHPPVPVLTSPGLPPHYPVFYPAPFMPQYAIATPGKEQEREKKQ